MIELIDGINYHNYLLDSKPESWFKRSKKETVGYWIKRTAYQGKSNFLSESSWRQRNDYWLEESHKISIAVLSFLRENKMKKETLEDLVGFDLNLKGSYDWKLSEIKKLESYLNKKLL